MRLRGTSTSPTDNVLTKEPHPLHLFHLVLPSHSIPIQQSDHVHVVLKLGKFLKLCSNKRHYALIKKIRFLHRKKIIRIWDNDPACWYLMLPRKLSSLGAAPKVRLAHSLQVWGLCILASTWILFSLSCSCPLTFGDFTIPLTSLYSDTCLYLLP